VTAEDWLRVDRELIRKKAATSKEVELPEAPDPQTAEPGRIVPRSEIEAPPMPPLPPPEVEEKGAIPPAAVPIEAPLAETDPPPGEPPMQAEVLPAAERIIPAPPPLIAAPEPAIPSQPPTKVRPSINPIPKEIEPLLLTPTPPRLPDPAKLKGFDPAAMQALLGVPDLLRWESHAQVYQYRGDKCVLDIIFYEDPIGGPFQAAHLSARGPGGQETEIKACLVDLLPAESWPETLLN
jgi:hypothetical protein